MSTAKILFRGWYITHFRGFRTTPNDAKGELNISNGGKVKTGEGIWLGIGTGSTATLNIGGKPGETAQEAGSIETPLIILSDTNHKNVTATLNFNHTSEDYSLNAAIKATVMSTIADRVRRN